MIEIYLYTSNPYKLQQAKTHFPNLEGRPAHFDEEVIKLSINESSLPHPLIYPIEISRQKFTSLPEKNGISVVSDSVLAVKDKDGQWMILNRDEKSHENIQRVQELIRQRGVLYFLGAVSFGTETPYSVLSFLEIPLAGRDFSIPINIDQIPEIVDYNIGFRVGYIDQNFNEIVVAETLNFDNPQSPNPRARPYISGLTEEVLKTAEALGNLEREIVPIIRNLISRYPFNTLSYYALTKGYDQQQLEEFYTNLPDTDFFEKYGGNCSLFSYHLGKHLERLRYQTSVIIFPSKNPDKENGHSGILIRTDNGLSVVADPGLSIPYLLPISNKIPLHYKVNYGQGKTTLVDVTNQKNLTLIVNNPKKGRVEFPALEIISLEEFRRKIPRILLDLHPMRKVIKIDYHDQQGNQRIRIVFGLKDKILRINGQPLTNPMTITEQLSHLPLSPEITEQIYSLLVE